MKTVLCICTYRRPDGLRKLLETLPSVAGTDSLEIVVSDNDAAGEGLAVCASLSKNGYPMTLYPIAATQPGISGARNAACQRALELAPDWVAFLDDDEWPESQWLSELFRVQKSTSADIIGGPTRSVFPEGTPAATRQNPYYGADMTLADESLCQLQAGGNFMIRASVLQVLQPEFFNPAFAHSGGEDLAFFTQLGQLGYTMAWAANAIVHEPVPESRLHDDWIRQRVLTIHNSRVRVMQLLQPGLKHSLVRVLKTTALGTVAALSTGLAWLGPDWAERARHLRWKFQGKLSAHLGRTATRKEDY